MTSRTGQEEIEFRRLLAAYRAAFADWSLRVRNHRTIQRRAPLDGAGVRQARTLAEHAQAAYRESRDSLADFLLLSLDKRPNPKAGRERGWSGSGIESARTPGTHSGDTDHRSRVERMAYWLWEAAGRPAGSADADWRDAEQIIRRTIE